MSIYFPLMLWTLLWRFFCSKTTKYYLLHLFPIKIIWFKYDLNLYLQFFDLQPFHERNPLIDFQWYTQTTALLSDHNPKTIL